MYLSKRLCPYCVCGYKSYGKILTKKPIIPSQEEQAEKS